MAPADSGTGADDDSPPDSAPDTGGDTADAAVSVSLELGAKRHGSGPLDTYDGSNCLIGVAASDADADGIPDAVIGLPGAYDAAGAAYVMNGPVRGTESVATAYATLRGEGAVNAGRAVASAGDVDADGLADILIGAPDVGYSGEAYLLYGPIQPGDSLLRERADVIIVGEANGYRGFSSGTGTSVAGLGDVDGDSLTDIAVAADAVPFYGAAYVLRGPLPPAIQLGEGETRIGGEWLYNVHTVAAAEDNNADGHGDLLVGHGEWTYLFYGPIAGSPSLTDADATFSASEGVYVGYDSLWGGDLDADGYSDLLLGGFNSDLAASDAGAAWIVSGPSVGAVAMIDAGVTFVGELDNGDFGASGSGVGDVDGDEVPDILIGEPGNWVFHMPGTAYLFLGPFSGTIATPDADVTLLGEGSDWAGSSVAPAGDMDGDGRADLLIGGAGDDDGGEQSGALWVVYASELFGP